MKRITKKDWLLLLMQLSIWAMMLLLPTVTAILTTRDTSAALASMRITWFNLQSPFILYFVNFYLLWRFLFDKRHYKTFVLVNFILFACLNYGFFIFRNYHNPQGVEMPPNWWIGMMAGMFVYFLLNCAAVTVAIAIRHFLKTREVMRHLEEEKRKNVEAELAWLKNQINPHFLFNTLNNISSLTQIDPDGAQDAIAQLSDLLRYAIYKTDKPLVPIAGEVEFMRNYIGLMQLRCNEKTAVNTSFNITDNQMEVAPLLFISLIENAFKHGVSSNKPSHIDIRVEAKDNALSFVCDNTNYPKTDVDRSGSGIGLENTRRRLELMYHDRYTWEQTLDNDIYHVKINIKP